MTIIRRNADGTIVGEQETRQSHPALTTRRGMSAMSEAGRAVPPMMHEIATKVNNAKDKPRKLKVLREHDSVPLRQVLKGAFDPRIEWMLPKGDVPYTANDAPVGTEHTVLHQEAKRLYLFTKGGDNTLSSTKREVIFIQMLEGLCAEEAAFLVSVVNQRVNNEYKGFTANLVKDAFNWDDDFMQKEDRPSFQV